MHQKSFPWKWRSVVESPKEAWCQSERPGRILLTNRRNMAFSFMPFVVELLRLPFSCYNFQLFVWDSSFYYYFEEDVCDLWIPSDRTRTLRVLSNLFDSWKQSCCGGDITALYPRRGRSRAPRIVLWRLQLLYYWTYLARLSGVDKYTVNYLKAKFPRQLNYFRRLFFLVVNGFLRLCGWYREKDILFKWSN